VTNESKELNARQRSHPPDVRKEREGFERYRWRLRKFSIDPRSTYQRRHRPCQRRGGGLSAGCKKSSTRLSRFKDISVLISIERRNATRETESRHRRKSSQTPIKKAISCAWREGEQTDYSATRERGIGRASPEEVLAGRSALRLELDNEKREVYHTQRQSKLRTKKNRKQRSRVWVPPPS